MNKSSTTRPSTFRGFRQRPLLPLVALFVAAMFSPVAASLGAEQGGHDWTVWSGPWQNHTSPETGLVEGWDPDGGPGSNLLWKSEAMATRSTPMVMDGRVYVISRADPGTPTEGEKVVCADAATGKILWENRFNVYLSDVPAERVGWSSCVGDPESGNVYALGVSGFFQCIDAKTGKTKWSYSLHEQFGLLSTYGGRTNTPIVFEDTVIISAVVIGWGDMAKPAHRFIAMDKRTGEVRWFRGTRLLPDDTTYSTPVIASLGGQAAMVFGSGDGAVWALQPRTGEPIWTYQLSLRGINTSPLVVGDTVYIGHSEENIDSTAMGKLVALRGNLTGNITARGALWKRDELMVGKSSPLMVDGKLIVVTDGAKIMAVDPRSGRTLAQRTLDRAMRGTPLFADGKIYCCTANGRCFIFKPTDEGFTPLGRPVVLPRGEEIDGSPVVARGRVYIPTTGNLYCLGKEDTSPAPVKLPGPPEETPAAENPKPAHVQIVPAEALLRPGDKQQYSVRLYNARGQLLKNADPPAVTFSVEGRGTVSETGTYAPPGGSEHHALTVVAKVGDLTGRARVRVVPPLPWKFDFSGGNVPITWVGCRYRHVVREVDGNKVMVKVTTIPKGTRSQGSFGQTDLSNYTIQADVLGNVQNEKTPDIGITAQGYILDMRGVQQQLQIRSWAAQLRMAKTIPFTSKPGVWYTMKLRAAVESSGGKPRAVLRGKVWPRGENEPEQWTIEATDDSPQRQGSPGLFGDATNAEIFLDNISVVPNEQ